MLGLAVTARLYRENPGYTESELSKRRASLVSTVALASVARRLDLGPWLKLGKGERRSGGSDKDSLLADVVEAIIGATYLSAGIDEATAFVMRILEPIFGDPALYAASVDAKTQVQQEANRRGLPVPEYETVGSGPDHDRRFTSTIEFAGASGHGEATSKKAAELEAARDLMRQLIDTKN